MALLSRILLAATLIGATTAARAQQDDDAGNAIDDLPHITIVGHASAEVVPDLATISLGVKVERAKALDAMAEAARVTKAMVDAAKAQGVEARDIRTPAIALTQVFDTVQDANGRVTGQRPRGFSASSTVSVRTRALDKAGALAQSLLEQGATEFNGITFSLENAGAVEDRLGADAVRNAQGQASLAVAALGVKLGRVLLIERPQTQDGGALAPRRMMAAPAPAITAEAGTQVVQREMEVTWALEP